MQNLARGIHTCLCLALAAGLAAGCSKAAKKERHLARANAHLAAGDYDRAEIEYLNVLKLGGTNLAAIENLGRIYHEQGRTLAAFQVLGRAKELNPANLEVRLQFGKTLLSGGGFKEAREEALYILGRAPTNDEALTLLVDSSMNTNDLRDAQQRLEKLRPLAASRPGFHLAWGGIHFRNRDPVKAEVSFREALAVGTNFSSAHLAMGNLHAMKNELKEAEAEFKTAAELAPLRSIQRVRYAEFKAATGDVTGARQVLEELRKQAPDYLPALLQLAVLELAERKFDASEALLKQVLARDPANLQALALSPRLNMARGDADKAVTELEKLVKLNPKNSRTHYQVAVAALMNNDQTRALSSLTQATTLDPDYAEAALLLSELRLRRGEAAVAVTSLTRLLQKHPSLVQARLLLAVAHRAQNDLDQALGVYRALARDYPTNPQPLLMAGMIQRQQRDQAAARVTFENALKMEPGYLPAVEQLVQMDLVERKFENARRRLETELSRHTNSPLPSMLLSQVYLAQTNLAQAEAALLKAAQIAPDYGLARTELARLYVATGRQNEALERLQAVVKQNTNDLASWMQIAILHTAATNHTAARATYEKILAVHPKYVPALNNLAWLYSEFLGDLTLAYDYARKSSDLQPGEPASADTLGWVLFKRGEYGRALAVFQESARKLPEEAEVQYHLGLTHYMLGEEEPARVALRNALQLQGDFRGNEEARHCLAVLAINPDSLDSAKTAELEKSLGRNPRDPVLLGRLASVYQRLGSVDKAVDAYERALKLNPSSVAMLVRLSQLYSTRPDKAEEAINLARKAHDLAPEDARITHLLAGRVWSKGDHKWALSLLEESARKLSDDSQVLYDLGLARYSLGLLDSAMEAMRSAKGQRPAAALGQEIDSFLLLNTLLRNPQQAETSLPMVRETLKARSNNVPALMVLAAVEARKANAAEAERSYEKALAIFPAFTPARRELARLNFGPLKNRGKAYEQALRVREADRSDLDIVKILGITTYERGEFTRAGDLLTEYTRARADDAEAFFHLGLTRYRLKQIRECKDALNKALALQPNAAFAAEAKRILAELK